MSKQPSRLKRNLSVCPSAVALKRQEDKSRDDGNPSGSEDGRIPEGELLLQVSEQQAAMFLLDVSTHVKDRLLKTRNLEFVRIWDL